MAGIILKAELPDDHDVVTVELATIDVYIIRTPQGYVVDVYDKKGNNIDTATYWDMDFVADEEVENAP